MAIAPFGPEEGATVLVTAGCNLAEESGCP
jgi:hypothetical protein